MPLTPQTRDEIVQKLKRAMEKCAPPMVVSKESRDAMELIGNTPVPYGSTKKIVPGMYFCSFVARKEMVSFYFFPLYHDTSFVEAIPTLRKTLKGKTCFNIKKADQLDEKELAALLKKGVSAWKKAGYVK